MQQLGLNRNVQTNMSSALLLSIWLIVLTNYSANSRDWLQDHAPLRQDDYRDTLVKVLVNRNRNLLVCREWSWQANRCCYADYECHECKNIQVY